MLDQQDRHAQLLAEVEEQLGELVGLCVVEAGRRLIQHDEW